MWVRPSPSSQCRVCCWTRSPAASRSAWRRASYSMARPRRPEGVEVLDLAAGAEGVGADGADRHVGVDAQRPLLHLPVADAGGDEDGPQLADVLAGLLGRSARGAGTRSPAAGRRPGCSRRGSASAPWMRPSPPTWVDLPVSSSRWARSMPDDVARRTARATRRPRSAGRTGRSGSPSACPGRSSSSGRTPSGGCSPPTARPKRMASSTAFSLTTGSVPGRPRVTGSTLVLGSSPKRLGAPENILVAVASSAWTSRPHTSS